MKERVAVGNLSGAGAGVGEFEQLCLGAFMKSLEGLTREGRYGP